ncbi:recombinase RecT [Streptomyces sp. TRM68367]|uniref:recombinase RecT n=1 Tax=Streptomyces sp. TRM68367 TaxID=2758415 RepID=UPI00165C7FF4|nr:recombinase RecT [Streptomyces sp. TRM68367]MBC9729894.1 recombinase RecT [Streptomyces sp. TRM68367]
MSNTLLSRVKAATSGAPAPAGPPLEDVQHDPGQDIPETPAEHAEQEAAADAAMEWLLRYEGQFTEALPKHMDTGAFFAAVRNLLPDIAGCSPASQLQSLLTCARFGLIPDGHQAVIKADGRTAVFVPTYHGYIDLMYRSGRVQSVHVGMIHAGDDWTFEPSAPQPDDFMHRPRVELPKEQRGEPILAYAFCWMRGGGRSQVIVLSREDAEQIRDEYSEAYRRAEQTGKRDSFWHTRFPDMWLKTGIRRLFKYVPTSPELRQLAAADEAGEQGLPQILHAPDPETEALTAEAEQAAEAAEGSQEPAGKPVAVKVRRGRSKPKKQRGGRKR